MSAAPLIQAGLEGKIGSRSFRGEKGQKQSQSQSQSPVVVEVVVLYRCNPTGEVLAESGGPGFCANKGWLKHK